MLRVVNLRHNIKSTKQFFVKFLLSNKPPKRKKMQNEEIKKNCPIKKRVENILFLKSVFQIFQVRKHFHTFRPLISQNGFF